LAGIEGSGRSAFLAYDSLGSFLWTAVYAGLGYLFANRLALIAASMARFGAIVAAGIGIPLACYAAWRLGVMTHMLGHLRLRRITPLILNEKITSRELIAIIDLSGSKIVMGTVPVFAELSEWTRLISSVGFA